MINVNLQWDNEHLQKAISNVNSYNHHLKDPITYNLVESNLLGYFSSLDSLDGSAITVFGITFVPDVLLGEPDEGDEGDIFMDIFLNISIPPSYDFEGDIYSKNILSIPEEDIEIKLN